MMADASGFQHLQLFAPAIQSLATNHYNEVLQEIEKAKESQEKAKAILQLSKDSVLWMKLAGCKRILNPLSIAQLITQANTTRLNPILLTTGKLYTQYQAFYVEASRECERQCCTVLMASLECQWENCNQDIFIAAAILNPFIERRRLCFNLDIPTWQHSGLYHLLVRLFERFYGPAPPEMWIDWVECKSCSGAFSDVSLGIQQWIEYATRRNKSPNPVVVWNHIDLSKLDSPLRQLALCLSLSSHQIVPHWNDFSAAGS